MVSLKIESFTIDDGNANQASQISNLIGREKKNKRVARAARILERFSATFVVLMTTCVYKRKSFIL